MSERESMKSRMKRGKPVFGTFFKTNSPSLAEMLCYSGFDFLILDCEHSNFSYSDVENLIRACEVAGKESVVRMPSCDPEHAHHYLEFGATGIEVPQIERVEDAVEAARQAVFFPGGDRVPVKFLRAAKYGFWAGEKGFKETAEASSLVVVHVESADMAKKVEQLCAVPQIDVLFVGPGDLSFSMGKPGQLNDPEVAGTIESIIKRTIAGGKAAGMYCATIADIEKYVAMGATYIAYASETVLLSNALKDIQAPLGKFRQ